MPLIKKISDKYDRDIFPVVKNIYRHFNKVNERKVAFVAGVQRSGTNMMMDVLERSLEADVYHERDERAFDNYQMRNMDVIQDLYSNSKAPLFIIKSLCELQDLSKLMDFFSPAKTIWVTRNYEDIVNSMLVSFSNQAKQIVALSKDRSLGGWWLGKGMTDETYELVKGFASENIDDASAAALQWYFRSKLFFDQNFDSDSRVMLVKYENLVTKPEQEFSRIFEFLELKYSKRISAKVFASSIRRRPSPNIHPDIRVLCDDVSEKFSQVKLLNV